MGLAQVRGLLACTQSPSTDECNLMPEITLIFNFPRIMLAPQKRRSLLIGLVGPAWSSSYKKSMKAGKKKPDDAPSIRLLFIFTISLQWMTQISSPWPKVLQLACSMLAGIDISIVPGVLNLVLLARLCNNLLP